MKKQILFLLAVLYCISTNAQVTTASPTNNGFAYYMVCSGVSSKRDVTQIETVMQSHDGIVSCSADRIPVRYFLVRATRILTVKEVQQWINQRVFTIKFFEEGEMAREKAILASRQPKSAN